MMNGIKALQKTTIFFIESSYNNSINIETLFRQPLLPG